VSRDSNCEEPRIELLLEDTFFSSVSFMLAQFFDVFEMIIICDPDSDFSEFSKSLFSESILTK